MAEFGLLWFLWWRALGYGDRALPALIAIGYAITDELHQSFVHGRVGSPVDVLIDATGVLVAMLAAQAVRRRRAAAA
jgi:VanZ family protein